MNEKSRRAGVLVLAVHGLVVAGCASMGGGRFEPPQGTRALGLEFGADRDAVARSLARAGIGVGPVANEPDALLANRCPGAPVRAPCRLFFSPQGLYAAQVEADPDEAPAMARALERAFGQADRAGDPRAAEGAPVLVAGWDRPGWTVAVSRSGAGAAARALCRVEYDRLAPPVIAGVPLGRLRDEVEHALDVQGATLVQRDDGTTTYLGCPQGATDALSCVVLFRGGRAAAVSEVRSAEPDDAVALSAWRVLARRYEREIGRAPETVCPSAGPDRIGGDCTATWSSDRLVVVVGAHRNAGSKHRGAISVYTAFTYPPLAAAPGEEEAEARAEAP